VVFVSSLGRQQSILTPANGYCDDRPNFNEIKKRKRDPKMDISEERQFPKIWSISIEISISSFLFPRSSVSQIAGVSESHSAPSQFSAVKSHSLRPVIHSLVAGDDDCCGRNRNVELILNVCLKGHYRKTCLLDGAHIIVRTNQIFVPVVFDQQSQQKGQIVITKRDNNRPCLPQGLLLEVAGLG
jgi:hypothetical protein